MRTNTPPVFIILFDSGDQYEGDQRRFVGVAQTRKAAEEIIHEYIHGRASRGGSAPEYISTRARRWCRRSSTCWVSDFDDRLCIERETPKREKRVR
jgi:hypothetical protein